MRPHPCIICNIIAAIFAIVVAGPITWWAIDRTPALVFEANGVPVPNPAMIGKELDLQRGVIVLKEGCDIWYNREIMDSTGFVWSFPVTLSTYSGMAPGFHKTHSSNAFVVPLGAAAGPAVTTSNIWSSCNPLQKFFPVHYRTPPIDFTIERPPIS